MDVSNLTIAAHSVEAGAEHQINSRYGHRIMCHHILGGIAAQTFSLKEI
jgi:hypothetical protein